MNALLTSLVVLLTLSAAALAGSSLGKRLPPHHLSDASKEILKFGAGSIATLAALVLGLLVASAKSSYDAKATEIEQTAAKIILLDQWLNQYGPDAKSARDLLRSTLRSRLSMTWVKRELADAKPGESPNRATAGVDAISAAVAALAPANDAQRSLQARSLHLLDDFMQVRWLFIAQATDAVSFPLLAVLVVWLATIAFCTALYAPRNATVAAVGLLCAVSVAAAIFLIVEMYDPYTGILKIPDTSMRIALRYLES